jgi:hypothetical protein
MIKLTRINEYVDEHQDWLIEGILCPWLTLLSGQPKHGKSILAGHIAISLIQQTPLIGRNVSEGNHLVAWLGYDAGWKQEVISRWGEASNGQIILCDSIRSLEESQWLELAQRLKDVGVTLLVIDHLYGMAGALGLNDAEQVAVITNLLRPIYEDFGIAVLLLAQAGKGPFSNGRAAHSVAIEGEARTLIRISDKKKDGARKIDLISNTSGEESICVRLTPEVIEIKESKKSSNDEKTERESPDIVRDFLAKANKKELTSWSGAGREIHRLGFSASETAGRSMSTRWRKQGLLKMEAGLVVPGDSLLPAAFLTHPYINTNASSDYLPHGVYERVYG